MCLRETINGEINCYDSVQYVLIAYLQMDWNGSVLRHRDSRERSWKRGTETERQEYCLWTSQMYIYLIIQYSFLLHS